MKKYITLLLILSATFLFAQNYHDTQGKLEISSSGQSTYSLPIALPPSIQSVGPTINLVYASGQTGGIAGEGWSINSISKISRISTRKDIDGYIDGVDFDANDMLALDGQRLILVSGTYWADGSKYQTETQSNTKIELFGSGATIYFIVTAPDGSRSWYGGSAASDLTAYYIYFYLDTNNNNINYHYTKPYGKSLCIADINFSANATNAILPQNSIVFTYKAAKRIENLFIKGIKQEKVELLDEIKVYTNSSLFRKYVLTHIEDTQSGYQKISQIQEFNGALEPANPVTFEYNNTTTIINGSEISKTYTNNIDFENIILSGDFDGDGRLDFVGSNNKLYTKLFDTSSTTPINAMGVTAYRNFPITTLLNGRLNQSQSIAALQLPQTNQLTFRIYNLVNSTFSNTFNKTISIPNYGTCVSNCPNNPCTYPQFLKSSNEYLEGDFNGDGISEMLILSHTETKTYTATGLVAPTNEESAQARGEDPNYNCSYIYTKGTTISAAYMLDFNPNSSTTLGDTGYVQLQNVAINPLHGKKYTADFNGDGKADILAIRPDKSYTVIGFKQLTASPWVQFDLLGQGTIPDYSLTKQLLIGDFNGDGKADFTLPDTEGGEYDNTWHIYYGNPNPAGDSFFTKETLDIVQYWPATGETFSTQKHFSTYYALDVNKDGKSDIVRFWRRIYNLSGDDQTQWKISTYINNIGNTNITTGSKFPLDYTSPCVSGPFGPECAHASNLPDLPFPIFSSYQFQGLNQEAIILRKNENKITYVNFTKDVSQDGQLIKVTSSGGNIVDDITYQALVPATPGTNGLGLLSEFYSSGDSVNYPMVELKRVPSSIVVSQLTNTSLGVIKKQDFRYHGLIANMNGQGTIGFRKTARSGWYQTATAKRLWSIFENSAGWRGALQRSYTQLANNGSVFSFVSSGNPSGIVNSTTNAFNATTSGNIFTITLASQTTEDFLSGVKNEKTYTYSNPYQLQLTLTSKNYLGATLQGTNVTTNDYDNNPTGIGAAYYIGRPKKTTNLSTAYGDTSTSEEKNTYTGTRLTKVEKKANNPDSVYLTEDLEYFANGNLKKRTVSAPGAIPAVSARVVEYTYDTSERFVKTTKDISGLITTVNAYDPKYGLATSVTDPYGLTTLFEYDTWGKKTKTTDYLGKKIVFTYAKSGSIYTTTQLGDDGSSSLTQCDALGRIKRKATKNINGLWSFIETEYDFLDRKKRESEPYLDGSSATQWINITYDDYNRVIGTSSFTGQTCTNTYTGLTVSTYDGTKTVSSTKNSNGHVVSTTDPGGTIINTYYASGNLKTATYGTTNPIILSMEYDGWGRKTKLTDPSAGIYEYKYNVYGETLEEKTPNGKTEFIYDATGKLTDKWVYLGSGLVSSANFAYFPNTSLLWYEVGTDEVNGNTFQLIYEYDAQKRLITVDEFNPQAAFQKKFEYDAFGRPYKEFYKATNASDGKTSSKWILNTYTNGFQYQIKDFTSGDILWQIDAVNARGQLTSAKYNKGIGLESHAYDSYGFPSATTYKTTSGTYMSANPFMTLTTTFNAAKGLLNSRNYSIFGNLESFGYDSLDRLTDFTNGANVTEQQIYDSQGRITQNSTGAYSYGTKPYQAYRVALTPAAVTYYTAKPLQEISYNIFKSPVSIYEQGKDRIDFEYNSQNSRTTMYYGSTNTDFNARPLRKFYSAGGDMEIKVNSNGTTEFITYIGGDGYSAPVIYKTNGLSTSDYYYLHRDYLGSILAITNSAGQVVEKRHFDAWGNLVILKDANNNNLTTFAVLDRGYTGHEHLLSVGLINMNGRLYDPMVRRFLQPDNFVQDPSNTQNFNRYSYVLNNPLVYTDPSGEIIMAPVVAAILIGAAIAALTYTVTAIISDTPMTAMGLLQSVAIGAFSGAVTFGIGSACSSITNFALKASIQAYAHGLFQGAITGIQGGEFWQGFAAGSLSSVASSLYAGVGADAEGWHGLAGVSKSNETGMMIMFGTVSGGLGASLTGGNFWMGAATGLMVSALNHAMHDNADADGEPKQKSKLQVRKERVEPTAANILETEGNALAIVEVARDSPMAKFVRNGAPKAGSVTKVLKVGGTAVGVAGIALETVDYANGNISGLEYGVDTTIAASAILVSGPAAPFVAGAALIYFGGKAIYEYSSGKTLFTKPK